MQITPYSPRLAASPIPFESIRRFWSGSEPARGPRAHGPTLGSGAFNIFNMSPFQHFQHFNISTFSTFQHFNIWLTIQDLNISTFQHFNISTFNMLIQHSTLKIPNQTSVRGRGRMIYVFPSTTCIWVLRKRYKNISPNMTRTSHEQAMNEQRWAKSDLWVSIKYVNPKTENMYEDCLSCVGYWQRCLSIS